METIWKARDLGREDGETLVEEMVMDCGVSPLTASILIKRGCGSAEEAMASIAPLAAERPMSFGSALSVMVGLAADPVQLVVVSDGESELAAFGRAWRRPGAVSSVVTSAQALAFAEAGFELYEGRTATQGPTAYACREFVCDLPVHAVEQLRLP